MSESARNWQGEAERAQAEIDALRYRLKEAHDERDRAREECGHAKAMRASVADEMYRFVTLYREQKERAEAAEAERDRARSLAATLEAQLAQVEALHVETACGCGCGEIDCEICGDAWPCQTIAALKGDA